MEGNLSNHWHCDACGSDVDPGFEACWQCGRWREGDGAAFKEKADAPGSAPPPFPGRETLDCLRCDERMARVGTRRFHEGSPLPRTLLGAVGELMVNREAFEVFACPRCGKVEFFLARG